uniref:Integrase catalytic domain-containing protein n=3 Tax=Klebsiella TaxID=570 RepID=Q6U5W9_KLEPN|nr:unknown [Klebsiella pneumoniae CG43]
MLMQHIGVGYFGYYRATAYAMKHSLMPEIAKLRMKALNFWDKHGIRAAADAFDVSTRTLYWWRRLLRTGGPEALIPRSKAPLVRRSRHWHPDVLKEIRRLRTELPNLGKEQIFVRLKPWCEARHFTCPSTSTIGRIIAGAHDKMRMIPVRLSARGKARLIKKRSVKPRRPKQYRPVKTGELIGMDAIELRMGDLRRYIITMIDEHSDYALALAVPSLNSDITSHFFSKATKLFPVAIRQVVTDNGKEFLGNFDKTLQEASIKHIWTYPYTPKMNATCERFNRTLREQFIEFNELLLFEDLNLFNQRMAEYLVLYNSKRPHKSLELMTPVDYILRESKNCNMWWTHTIPTPTSLFRTISGPGRRKILCFRQPVEDHEYTPCSRRVISLMTSYAPVSDAIRSAGTFQLNARLGSFNHFCAASLSPSNKSTARSMTRIIRTRRSLCSGLKRAFTLRLNVVDGIPDIFLRSFWVILGYSGPVSDPIRHLPVQAFIDLAQKRYAISII